MESTTRLLIGLLPRPIHWRLRQDAPNEVPIVGYPEWLLVTPIGLARAGLADAVADPHAMVLVTKDGELFMMSQKLALRHTGNDLDGSHVVARNILSRLRYVSRQATMPREAVGVIRLDKAPPYDKDIAALGALRPPDYALRSDVVETAITAAHLRELGGPSSTPRVHADVMLDALEAYLEGDYRKAILYSAIAIEACATDVLDDAYETVVRQREARHRVIDIRVAGSEVRAKDPVYLALSDDFSTRLHERPLYLLGRSLLVDDAETYRVARMLYQTRNRLAHRGTHDENEKFFPLTKDGSDAAISAAIKTLRWLGDSGPYVLPGSFDTQSPAPP